MRSGLACALVAIAALLALISALPAPAAVARVKSKDVVRAFQSADLEAEDARRMTSEDFGCCAPRLTRDATRFFIPSLGEDNGGRAFVFQHMRDLRATRAFYDAFGDDPDDPFFSWTFVNRGRLVLVQINGELPSKAAKRYKRVVAGL